MRWTSRDPLASAAANPLVTGLILAAGYVIAGRLGLLLAVPPGYATAIFPPAGVAVAAMFIGGVPTLPWTFLGSLLLNLWVGHDTHHEFDPLVVIIALLIAAASALQAAVGGWTLRRIIGYPVFLDNGRQLVRFFLAAPAVCLTSASLSLIGMWALGAIEPSEIGVSWFTWWIGDTLGVLLVVPLILVAVGEPRALWHSRAFPVALPLVLFFGLFAFIFVRVSAWESDQSLLEFRILSQQLIDKFQAQLGAQQVFLEQLNRSFVGPARLSRVDFRSFVQNLLRVFPDIQAVEWAPRVDPSQRDAFEAAQQSDIPDFAIRERDGSGQLVRAGARAVFYPVTYAEPTTGNETAVGFDLASEPHRGDAVDHAFAANHVIATAPIRLLQESTASYGMLLISAVPGGANGSGVVLIALRMRVFMETLLGSARSLIDLQLVDLDTNQALYESSPGQALSSDIPPNGVFRRSFAFATRHYALRTAPTPLYLTQHRSWQSMAVLVAGAFSTCLLGALLLLGSGERHRFTRLLADRTRERNRIWQVSEDLLGVSTFEGYFTSVNPAWTALLGWTEDEIKRIHVDALRHPDDAAAAHAARARLAQGVPTVRMENRFRHKDGSWRWIYWTLTVEQGLIYVIGRHITNDKAAAEALRESERQFRLLVAGVVDYAMFMLTPDGIVSSWNAGAQRIKGYTASDIIGRHFSHFYTETDRQAGIPAVALATARRNGTFEAEGWRVRKDGSLFFASVVIDAISDESGKLIGFAKITRDITERRDAQEKLRRVQEQLAHTQKIEALGKLTGGIAHDFNNMLMVVRGHAETLRPRIHDPQQLRSLNAIELAATRGEKLTRQLLAFSRGQMLTPTVINLKDRLEAVREVLASSARGDLELVIDVPSDIWPVNVDIGELELALVNLVVNARDAMPYGGTITVVAQNVRLAPLDTADGCEGEYVAVRVKDAGIGIAKENLLRVFEPFFTTKEFDKGTGLGLSQVYGFSRQSGGTAAIVSSPGVGTIVTIYLPRCRDAKVAENTEEASSEAFRGTESILLVEDNAEVREIALTLLEQLGYFVLSATNADEALLTLATGTHVDLVFTDIVMPGAMDGIGLVRRIASLYPGIALLLSSGYSGRAEALDIDFPVLRKPYKLSTLAHALREAINRTHSRHHAMNSLPK